MAQWWNLGVEKDLKRAKLQNVLLSEIQFKSEKTEGKEISRTAMNRFGASESMKITTSDIPKSMTIADMSTASSATGKEMNGKDFDVGDGNDLIQAYYHQTFTICLVVSLWFSLACLGRQLLDDWDSYYLSPGYIAYFAVFFVFMCLNFGIHYCKRTKSQVFLRMGSLMMLHLVISGLYVPISKYRRMN